MKFFQSLKERRVVQFVVTYCAGGWIALTAVDQVVDRSVLPEIVYRVALTLFLCGLPGALVVSWFHGAKGRQTMPAIEKWILGSIAIFALSASGYVARSGMAGEGAEVGLGALEPYQDPTRVAVLYFESRGGGEDDDILASGLTESLIDELSSVDALHVVSRNGSELFRGSDAPSDSIGRVLEVGTLVEGRVQAAGDRVRVDVTMTESQSGRALESFQDEGARDDLFALQDAVAERVSDFLREEIGVEVGEIESRSGTSSIEAWELLQRAHARANDAEELGELGDFAAASRELSAADSLLELAEQADPEWLEPVTQRGWLAYEQSRLGGLDRINYRRWIETGMGHAQRALARAPSDADALELRGTLRYWRYLLNLAESSEEASRLFRDAERDFRQAVASDPEQASAYTSLSHLLLNKGDIAGAKTAARNSYEADPFLRNADVTLWRLTSSSWNLADAIEAERWCDEGLRRFPEDFRFRKCQLMLYALPGYPPDVEDAWAQLEAFVERSPAQMSAYHESEGHIYMAMALTRANLPDSARAVAVRGRANTEVDPLREISWLESIARTWLGDYEEAARLLGLFIAANPTTEEGYREAAVTGEAPWYFEDLVDTEAFRDLVGVQ